MAKLDASSGARFIHGEARSSEATSTSRINIRIVSVPGWDNVSADISCRSPSSSYSIFVQSVYYIVTNSQELYSPSAYHTHISTGAHLCRPTYPQYIFCFAVPAISRMHPLMVCRYSGLHLYSCIEACTYTYCYVYIMYVLYLYTT